MSKKEARTVWRRENLRLFDSSCLSFSWIWTSFFSSLVFQILASATLAGAFGSALATGIAQLNGETLFKPSALKKRSFWPRSFTFLLLLSTPFLGVHGIKAFQYIFICEGLPSIATAPLIWFFFPDSPESASFLTEAEKELSRRRLIGASTLRSDDKMTWKDTLMVLKDYRLYLHYLAYIGISAPFSSISLFQPTIVSGLGYSSGVKANLFSWVKSLTVNLGGKRRGKLRARRSFSGSPILLLLILFFHIFMSSEYHHSQQLG